VVTITIVILGITDGITLWAFLRFTMGAAMAALLAIADSWINDRTSGGLRGGVIATYGTVIGLASLVGQIVFLVTDATADGFALIFAITTNIAVALVAATSSEVPTLEQTPCGVACLRYRGVSQLPALRTPRIRLHSG
jgi:MFS family permease